MRTPRSNERPGGSRRATKTRGSHTQWTGSSSRQRALHPPVVLETCVLLEEEQVGFAGGTVAVLGHLNEGVVGTVDGHLVVVLGFAIDEEHDVCILLERARLPQVRQLRRLVLACLEIARELRQRDHGDLELASEDL